MNPLAIESHLRLVFVAWAVIILLALLMGRLASKVGQPPAVGEIAAGLLLGPSLLGALWPDAMNAVFPASTQQSLQVLAKLGIVLLMFHVGMEFDFDHLRSGSRTVMAVAAAGMLVPFAGGLLIAPWLHQRFGTGVPLLGFTLFTCIALSISALPIMGRILIEMDLTRTRLGTISIAAAAMDDAVGWVLLAAVTALVTSGFEWQLIAAQLVGLAVFGAFLMKVVGPLMTWFWRTWCAAPVGRERILTKLRGAFLGVLLVVLLASCLATNLLGVFSIFGAFLLGVALHRERSLVAAWRESIGPIVLVAFVPIFFTNTGLRTSISGLSDSASWLGFFAILAVAVIGKLVGCGAAARWTGMPTGEALSVGALMNTRGLMGLVAINVGADLGLVPPQLFTMLVLMALVTTAMTGPLLRRWLPGDIRELSAAQAATG